MAEYLSSIYGTEKDKVNCSFYFKIGACRHGDRCSRKHVKPNFSQTILMPNVYQNPSHDANCKMNKEELQQNFNDFYEDIFVELAKYGEIEEMNVCDNVGDHLVGNIYARYKYEEDAGKAVESLNNRFYAGRPLWAELSPVTDFREACCRQYENAECTRGGFCNFMHLKMVERQISRELFASQRAFMRDKEKPRRDQDQDRHHRDDRERYYQDDRERHGRHYDDRERDYHRDQQRHPEGYSYPPPPPMDMGAAVGNPEDYEVPHA
ncbi:hypothetical protein DFQ27_003784 [Actinomortierella ambigua]|uniref:Uncharacterized protein n=1 Tax=Actinomortierella ambigua TaxID=1343610 RepID=A0A9P6U4Z9_9FUNG|nr:hypothetical protein DFQ27_003784 [Actinomortierella ambigua]